MSEPHTAVVAKKDTFVCLFSSSTDHVIAFLSLQLRRKMARTKQTALKSTGEPSRRVTLTRLKMLNKKKTLPILALNSRSKKNDVVSINDLSFFR